MSEIQLGDSQSVDKNFPKERFLVKSLVSVGKKIDNLKGKFSNDRFNEKKFRGIYEEARSVDENQANYSDKRLNAVLNDVIRQNGILKASLKEPGCLSDTFTILQHLEELRFHIQSEEIIDKAHNFVYSFLSENIEAIEEALKRESKDKDLELSINLFKEAAEHTESPDVRNKSIDFLINHFLEGVKLEPEKEEWGIKFSSYEFIAHTVFRRCSDLKIQSAISVVKEVLNDPLLQEKGQMILARLAGTSFPPIEVQTRIQNELVKPEVEKLGIDYDAIHNAWRSSIDVTLEPHRGFSLRSMFELERENPGICKVLWEDFGIANFDRYPKSLLIDTFNQRDTREPYGILLFGRGDNDMSYAFNRSGKAFTDLSKKLRNIGYGLRLYECGDKTDIVKSLVKANRKYGAQNKIGFLIVAAHGSEDAIYFSITKRLYDHIDEKELEKLVKRNIVKMDDLKDPKTHRRLNRYGEFFEPDAEVLLISCSTGADSGLAHTLSGLIPGHAVTAPERPTNVDSIDVVKDSSGKLKFQVEYSHKDVDKRFSKGKEINSV